MLARLQLKDIACLCLPSARSEGVPLGPASKTDLKKKKWFLHSTQPHSILWHHASEPHQDPNTHSLMDRECSEADAVGLFCAPKNVVKALDRRATGWAMDLPMCRGMLCLWFIDMNLSICLFNSGWLRNLKWHKLTEVCASVYYILVRGGTVKESLWCQRAACPQVPLKLSLAYARAL